jgi:Spy/CpxP family protein refolding chaperone
MRKISTKILVTCLTMMAMFVFGGILAAQDPSAATPPDNEEQAGKPQLGEKLVERRLENLNKQLNLTDQQRDKIRPVLMHEVERIKEVRSNSSLTQGEARRRIALVRRNTN